MNIIIDDINIDYELFNAIANHYGNSATEFIINIQFKSSNKKRMSSKILNQIKADSNFQKFIKNTIEDAIKINYSNIVSQSLGNDYTSFQHKLEIWLTGNKLLISNLMVDVPTIEELRADMEYLMNVFLENHVSRTVFLKMDGVFQKI